MKDYDIADPARADEGKARIEWGERDMPVLRQVRERFRETQPLKGQRMSACLHITAETANLARTLQAGGADLVLCASNPLSTQDDVAASLVRDYEIPVYAVRGEDKDTYYSHLKSAIAHKPTVTMDDGADLVSEMHQNYENLLGDMAGSMEETTTGVIRLKAMSKDGALKIPVVAVNDAATKHLFDNRYGTGQSTIDGIIRASDVLLAGKTFVVVGYGWCGRGLADRARGMGASVVVTEVDPIKALEAAMDGFRVMPMAEAATVGDIFCSVTGNIRVLRPEHFAVMKDGTLLANSGHFDWEVDVAGLEEMAKHVNRGVREHVDEFVMPDGRSLHLLAQGRLINLSAAEGHPASVMDMSFATQALASEYLLDNLGTLKPGVYDVSGEVEDLVATLKLKSMGINIDAMTDEQNKYMNSWEMGT